MGKLGVEGFDELYSVSHSIKEWMERDRQSDADNLEWNPDNRGNIVPMRGGDMPNQES